MARRVVTIIQARTGSTRLPGKVLADLCGEPLLVRVVERARQARSSQETVVATSVLPGDDRIEELCRRRGWPCFRGSESDVLDRYYQAACAHHADVVVRLTADDPFPDGGVIDLHIERMLQHWNSADFVTDMMHQTFPLGVAVEVMPFDTLARLQRLTTRPELREHVTSLVYRQPELFVIEHVTNDVDYSHLRWTVDTAADLEFARRVFAHFGHDRFTWQQALAAVLQHPEWSAETQGKS